METMEYMIFFYKSRIWIKQTNPFIEKQSLSRCCGLYEMNKGRGKSIKSVREYYPLKKKENFISFSKISHWRIYFTVLIEL
jgi:hypothetical protein